MVKQVYLKNDRKMTFKNLNLIIAVMLLLSACGNSGTNKEKLKEELKEKLKAEMQQEADNEVADTEKQNESKTPDQSVAKLEMSKFHYTMLEEVEYDGEYVFAKAWADTNGDNFILFTEKVIEHEPESEYGQTSKSKYLYAYHFADKGDGFKLIRKIQDWEKECDIVMHADFRLSTLRVTDLDQDAKAEVTFVYRLGCNGDPTPVPMKLMILEDGDKYAIRGTTLVKMGPHRKGGEMTIGENMKNAPKAFLEHAKKIWNSDKEYRGDFEVFWVKFRKVIASNDKKALKAMCSTKSAKSFIDSNYDNFVNDRMKKEVAQTSAMDVPYMGEGRKRFHYVEGNSIHGFWFKKVDGEWAIFRIQLSG